MATHSSTLENPMDRGAWGATVHGVRRVEHDRNDLVCACTCTHTHTHRHSLSSPGEPRPGLLTWDTVWTQAENLFKHEYFREGSLEEVMLALLPFSY